MNIRILEFLVFYYISWFIYDFIKYFINLVISVIFFLLKFWYVGLLMDLWVLEYELRFRSSIG